MENQNQSEHSKPEEIFTKEVWDDDDLFAEAFTTWATKFPEELAAWEATMDDRPECDHCYTTMLGFYGIVEVCAKCGKEK